MAKNSYLKQRYWDKDNYLKLIISHKEQIIKLMFRHKPPSYIRSDLRLHNFSWSRKHKIWRSFLNGKKIAGVKKVFRSILKSGAYE